MFKQYTAIQVTNDETLEILRCLNSPVGEKIEIDDWVVFNYPNKQNVFVIKPEQFLRAATFCEHFSTDRKKIRIWSMVTEEKES